MTAAVCGGKRSFFEDIPSPPPLSKRPRCSSPTSPPPLDRLRALFPNFDPQLLERALEECNNDIDSAIKKLNELCLGQADENLASVEESGVIADQGTSTVDGNAANSENQLDQNKLPVDGAEWVDLFVREMMSASSMDDAKSRASKVLLMLEKSIMARAGEEAAQGFQKENMMLKEQMQLLMRENSILKRAVSIQHERQKEYDNRNQELLHLKQLLSQHQEQLRNLELTNYALTMHLKQAQQSSPMPGRFHPDVF